MSDPSELILRREGEHTVLASPGVGYFTCGLPKGALLGPGQEAGVLLMLGSAQRLVAPKGAQGRIVTDRPERVREPVGYGQALYELAPIAGEGGAAEEAAAQSEISGLVLPSSQTGRFYHRPGPDEDPFVQPGQVITDKTVVGLIEVMKTFAHIQYTAAGGLPQKARVVTLLVEDGGEVREGDPLLEVEPA